MDHYDEKELERHAIKDGEIDPETYSNKSAGCFVFVAAIFAGIVALIRILARIQD